MILKTVRCNFILLPVNLRLLGKRENHFQGHSFEESLRMLEKRYNVEFIIKNERLKKYSFTGTFTHQRLERILEYFKISSRIRWRYIDSADIKDEKSRIEIY